MNWQESCFSRLDQIQPVVQSTMDQIELTGSIIFKWCIVIRHKKQHRFT